MPRPSPLPAILLCNADYYGTLAATRSLGQQGVPVYVADPRGLAASKWSRYAARTLTPPPLTSVEPFLEWLVDFGRREPGVVLYPTSDEATFLFASEVETLSKHFRMYQPELGPILHVLDKKRLYATARDVGLDVPDTWFPSSDEAAARIAQDAPLPLLIKPRTQILSNTHSKGLILRDRSDVAERYGQFRRRNTHHPLVLKHLPEASQPMLQAYLPEAAEHIYSLAAFVDRSGTHFAARGSVKIFQRPRSLGIGLCFEAAPLDPILVGRVRELVRRIGYFGLFQLEFVQVGGRHLLIDFNPRFYNQLAFDVERGLPLPQLVHAAAMGDEDEVARLIQGALGEDHQGPRVFCNRLGMQMMLSTQRLAGRMSRGEAASWKSWLETHRNHAIDPSIAPGDLLPVVADIATQLYAYARHPRAFLRNVVLDRTG